MTTDEIFNYVMDDPEDTNPNVLKSLLNNISGGSSGTFIVNINAENVGGEYIFTADATAGEIEEAVKAGQQVIGMMSGASGGYEEYRPYTLNCFMAQTGSMWGFQFISLMTSDKLRVSVISMMASSEDSYPSGTEEDIPLVVENNNSGDDSPHV